MFLMAYIYNISVEKRENGKTPEVSFSCVCMCVCVLSQLLIVVNFTPPSMYFLTQEYCT